MSRAPEPAPPVSAPPGAGFGVYVHVPFCAHRCDYCAFATYADRDHLMDRYVAACRTEIETAAAAGDLREATTVFFGGGTPSRLHPKDLGRILAAIPRAPGAEVTVECNPEDAQVDRLSAYRKAGVTRMSFGIQSTAPHVLASLGRRHLAGAAHSVTQAVVAAGFPTWNLDLIFGAATETDADWRGALEMVLSLDHPPPHISAYALTVEPGTPLARHPDRHPQEKVLARRYETAERVLSAAGYRWEEISNWALPGHQCAHNALYWNQGDYRGFGSAAHSHQAGHRWWNLRTPDRYVAAVEAGRSPLAGEEHLTDSQRRFEGLSLSLRTPRGVPSGALPPDPALDGPPALVDRRGERAVLTLAGRLLADSLALRLVDDPASPPLHPQGGPGSADGHVAGAPAAAPRAASGGCLP